MMHEPECFYDGERNDDEWRDAEDNPCICDIIEAVREDERERAANRVGRLPHSDWCTSLIFDLPCDCNYALAVAAARGEDTSND